MGLHVGNLGVIALTGLALVTSAVSGCGGKSDEHSTKSPVGTGGGAVAGVSGNGTTGCEYNGTQYELGDNFGRCGECSCSDMGGVVCESDCPASAGGESGVGGSPGPDMTGGTSGTGGTRNTGGTTNAGGTMDTGGSATGATGGTAMSPNIGSPCATKSECDSDLACALGTCRDDCRTDADCPRGSLCSGTAPPYGCSLPAELKCASSADCPTPLVCGPDNKCRVECVVSDDCPRNDQTCRTQVCVSNDDPDPRWFECDDGETVCNNYLTGMMCDDWPPSCFQRMGCRLDGMNWGPIETCSPGPCYYQADADGRFSSSCQL